MSSTGVRDSNSNDKRIIKGLILNEAQFIQSLRVFANTSTLSGLGSTEGEINNSPKDPSGNYLSRLGDKMLGPFALSPPLDFTIEIDANNTIDIGPLNDNAQYTSNVQLDDVQPNSSVLDIIAGAAFDGQILILRTFAPTIPYTISQGTLGNGGNIQTGDGNDLTVGDLQTVTLIFDAALIIEANLGGSWRVLSVSSGGGGGGSVTDPILLPQLSNVPSPTNQTAPTLTPLSWSTNVIHVTVDRDLAFSFANLPVTNKYEGLLVILDIDSTGGYAPPEWPVSVVNPPIIPTTPNTRFSVLLYTINNGGLVTNGTSVGSSSSGFSGNLSDLNIDQDYDANTFDVKNVDRLIFDQAVGDLLAATDTGITSDVAKNMNLNIPTGSQYIFSVNNDVSPAALIVNATTVTSQTIVPAGTDDLGLSILPWNNIFANSGTIDNIIVDGAGNGVTNIGHLDFVDNLATPAASLSIYTDGTDILANTGASVVNLSDIGSGGGADTALSNLITTAINQDLNLLGNAIVLDVDKDTQINAFSDDQIQFITNSILRLTITDAGISSTIPISMLDSNKITNVIDPTNAQDVATKAYADSIGGPSNSISQLDSKVEVIDGGIGVIGFTLDNDLKATMSAIELLLGINLDMNSTSDILNPANIILANGLNIKNVDTENTEIIIPATDVLKIVEGADIRLQIDKDIIFDCDANDEIIFKGDGIEVASYNDSTGDWAFNPSGDIVLNPSGEINVFSDIDLQGTNTIDFGTSASAGVGSDIGAIQIKVNGITRLINFKST